MSIKTLSLSEAINAGLRRAMESDERVLVMGEDVAPSAGSSG